MFCFFYYVLVLSDLFVKLTLQGHSNSSHCTKSLTIVKKTSYSNSNEQLCYFWMNHVLFLKVSDGELKGNKHFCWFNVNLIKHSTLFVNHTHIKQTKAAGQRWIRHMFLETSSENLMFKYCLRLVADKVWFPALKCVHPIAVRRIWSVQ